MGVWNNYRGKAIPNGWSPRGGQTRSPYGPALDAGGSSSGSAVAVAAGFAPAALAAETDGSIIFPGNRAALYGIKPTVGLTEAGGGLSSIGGAIPVARSMDSVGVMAKGVWDLATVLGVIAESDESGMGQWVYHEAMEVGRAKMWRGLRIGVGPKRFFNETDLGTQVVLEVQAAIELLAASVLKWWMLKFRVWRVF